MSEKKKKKDDHQELETKCQEHLDGWKRALADYENLKRDLDKKLIDGRDRIKESFIEELLPVMDNFNHALRFTPDLESADKKSINVWLQGVTMIAKQFEDVLQNLGLQKIKTVGEIFNPNLHEVIASRQEADKKDQEIIEETQAGWRIGDHVIRPAKVIINQIS